MMLSRTDDPQLNRYLNYMFQVNRVPKRKQMEWYLLETGHNANGEIGMVTVVTNAATTSIQRWFQAAGLTVIQLDARGFISTGFYSWRVTFQVVPHVDGVGES